MAAPAITQLNTPRPDLFAFEVIGRIHESDIESMARTLISAFERLGTVDMLIIIRHWDGLDLGAAFDGEAMKAQFKANAHVRKYAVVGAPGWAKAMINAFSPFTPVEERTFDLPQEEEAWSWVEDRTTEAVASTAQQTPRAR